jgi:hypothetical protein
MYKYVIFFLLTLLVACQDATTTPEEALEPTSSRTYQATNLNFPNPERGFFQTSVGWNSYDPASVNLNADDMRRDRQQGISMVRVVYIIAEFKSRDLSPEFLASFRKNLADARTAGAKLIPTFAYSWPKDQNYTDPKIPENQDAPLSDILRHLEQLKPVIQSNSDVIATWDAGMVGAWGEWHSSTNNLVNSVIGQEINNSSRQIINKLLEVVPSNRTVAIRYPRYKQQFLGSSVALTSGEAFRGSTKARIAHKNDCFLASNSDFGTFLPNDPATVKKTKDYLHQENLFFPQYGETCSAEQAAAKFIPCDNAKAELAYARYSALNIVYNKDVLDGWRRGGCFDEIARRMGYRFELVSSSVPTSISKTQNLQMNFVIRNTGWANPYNPRRLELILRNTVTKSVYRIVLNNGSLRPTNTNLDPRFWQPDTTTTVSVNSPLPTNIPAGNYELLLNLPDPYRQLRNRPEYSIRLANENLWEASTGFNSLQQSLTIR